MLKIVLLRHGFSMGNKLHTLSGWHDVPLTEEGIEALQELNKYYPYPQTDGYCSSDLSRAYDTAKILFPDQEIVKIDGFREIHFGIYEGLGADQIDHDQFFDAWLAGAEVEKGESYDCFHKRVMSGLKSLSLQMLESGKESLTLVCHSGVIRLMYSLCRKNKKTDLFDLPVANGLGFELKFDYKDGQVEFIEINQMKTMEEVLLHEE